MIQKQDEAHFTPGPSPTEGSGGLRSQFKAKCLAGVFLELFPGTDRGLTSPARGSAKDRAPL